MATVTAIPRLSKRGKQGRSTLRIIDQAGAKFISHGVKVLPSQWNARQRRVRKSHPNADLVNALITQRLTAFCFVVAFCLQSFSLASAHASVKAAPSGTIFGIVYDMDTDDPLPGANVYLVGTALGSSTDIDGKYSITNVPSGTYTLRVVFIGYKQMDIEITIGDDEQIEQIVMLQFDVLNLDEGITITAQREGQLKAINRQLTADAILNAVSSERIREVPDANVAESVGRLPGVSIGRSGGEGQSVIIRGLAPRYNAITINGERVPSSSGG